MVNVSTNSGVGKKILRNNGKQFTHNGYFWLSSGKSEMEGSVKVYFSTEKHTIYRKGLGDLPKIVLTLMKSC